MGKSETLFDWTSDEAVGNPCFVPIWSQKENVEGEPQKRTYVGTISAP